VRRLDARVAEEIHPGGGQIHVDKQLHAVVSSNSRPSASQAVAQGLEHVLPLQIRIIG
jgi:hypothetical protein